MGAGQPGERTWKGGRRDGNRAPLLSHFNLFLHGGLLLFQRAFVDQGWIMPGTKRSRNRMCAAGSHGGVASNAGEVTPLACGGFASRGSIGHFAQGPPTPSERRRYRRPSACRSVSNAPSWSFTSLSRRARTADLPALLPGGELRIADHVASLGDVVQSRRAGIGGLASGRATQRRTPRHQEAPKRDRFAFCVSAHAG